jgi:transcriptional regulator with XRE-family HTH domain
MAIQVGRCRLKSILSLQKKTQTELANRVGLTKQRINDYANNRVVMSLLHAVRIADALDVSVNELYEWVFE